MTRYLALAAAMSLATAAYAGGDGRKPWELTVAERIAARTSPAAIAAHSNAASGSARFVLKGQADAALFMPSELFSWLLGGIDPDPRFRDVTRAFIADDLKPFGYDERTFWNDIATVSQQYTALNAKQRALTSEAQTATPQKQRAIRAELERIGRQLCAARAAALAAARKQLGSRFDEFLYTAVAPQITLGTVVPDATTAEHLKRIEGGCR